MRCPHCHGKLRQTGEELGYILHFVCRSCGENVTLPREDQPESLGEVFDALTEDE